MEQYGIPGSFSTFPKNPVTDAVRDFRYCFGQKLARTLLPWTEFLHQTLTLLRRHVEFFWSQHLFAKCLCLPKSK